MDFDLLFEEQENIPIKENQNQRQETVTCMYMRALRRLCACEEPLNRKVLTIARNTILNPEDPYTADRDLTVSEIQRKLVDAGYETRVCSSRGSGQSGHPRGSLCSRHTYLQLESGFGEDMHELTIIEPYLREEFQIVRPSRQYIKLLDALPFMFVGSPFKLAALIDFMSSRMEESFREVGLCNPPWRQKSSLLAKWELTEHTGRCQNITPSKLFQPLKSNSLISAGRPSSGLSLASVETVCQKGFVRHLEQSRINDENSTVLVF